ncbi:MAG: cupredoxin domain-containing protein [Stellaceae bacterium]
MLIRRLLAFALLAATLTAPVAARAADANFTLTIKDRKFDVAQLQVPASVKFTLTVKNLDAAPSEFESGDLNREKVVVGGGTVIIYLGPLTPGRYEFFDDFNPTARGTIVAK